ncbi:MAG: hypothetical protein QNJ14_06795 [Woeseiaceae bacterium]|nr:hypothetical protein [Woeseiaceae bacterium]
MTVQTKESGRALLRIAAILWVIWGLVHAFAGIITIAQDTPMAVQGIADAVEPSVLDVDYPAAAGAIINQHGFNLLWIGCVTTICAFFVWRRSRSAIFLAALVGGLADVGYFVFLDLGGFVNFVPGTVMTIFSSVAIITSFFVYFTHMKTR